MTKKNWTLTQESFDKLLAWLDPNRERAGEEYEHVRRTLISFFLSQSSHRPEELADETINRVAQNIDESVGGYVGDPANNFYEMARIVYAEHHRIYRSKAA
jgi:hypothetical protein